MRHFLCVFVAVFLFWTAPVDAQPWVTKDLQGFDAERITDIVKTEIYRTIGGEAPPLTLWPVEGAGAETLRGYAGKTVVLQFWTTSCSACIVQMADFGTLQGAYREQGVQMIYVSPESMQTIRRFLADREIAGLHRKVNEQELAPPYQTIAKPSTFVIGPEGRLQEAWLGMGATAKLRERLASSWDGE